MTIYIIMMTIYIIISLVTVELVYVILRLALQALLAAARLDIAIHQQRVLGGHRAEVTAAKAEYEMALRRALIPQKVIERLTKGGWTD